MVTKPSLTIFTLPKAFKNNIEVIQSNAIKSWMHLNADVEIILIGDDPGVADFAAHNKLKHIKDIRKNKYGTPLVNDLFAIGESNAHADIIAYVNADIILLDDFVEAISEVRTKLGKFLMVGRRWDLDLEEHIDFKQKSWRELLNDKLSKQGVYHGMWGIDYFVFTKKLWPSIPEFAIGRTSFDNWLVCYSLMNDAELVDASEQVRIIHQNHDYAHAKGGRHGAWKGVEAQENQRLAGNAVLEGLGTVSEASYSLRKEGLVRQKTEAQIAVWRKNVKELELKPRDEDSDMLDFFDAQSLDGKTKVSICLLALSNSVGLKRRIQKVLDQNYKNFELFVIGDKEIDFEDQRLRFIKANKQSYSHLINDFINKSTGDYLLWLNDADFLDVNSLQAYLVALDRFRDVDIVYPQLETNKNNSNGFVDWHKEPEKIFSSLLSFSKTPAALLYSKKLIDEIGLYDDGMKDFHYWIRVLKKRKFKAKGIAYPLVRKRAGRTENVSLDYIRNILDVLNEEFSEEELYPSLAWQCNKTLAKAQKNEILAMALGAVSASDLAIEKLLESVNIYPAEKALLNLSSFYISQGSVKDALHVLKKAQSLYPSNKGIIDLLKKLGSNESLDLYSYDDLVSVVLPTYNRKDELKRALQSIVAQKHKNIEVVVVNDGGEDVAAIVAETLADTNIKYQYYRFEESQGVSVARNCALKNLQGDYVCYLDDDDVFYPDHISLLLGFIKNSSFSVSYSQSYKTTIKLEDAQDVPVNRQIFANRIFNKDQLLVLNYIPMISLMHERSCLDRVGYFREDFKAHVDWEYWVRLSRIYDFAHVLSVTSEFFSVLGAESITNKRIEERLRTMKQIHEEYLNTAVDKEWVAQAQKEKYEQFSQSIGR